MIRQLLIPLILQVVGVAVIIIEFIVPTAGILAVMALGIFGYSLYYVFSHLPSSTVWVFVVVDLALIPVLVVVGIKMLAASGATLRDSLSTRDGAVSQPEEWAGVTGKEGIALTHLRPSGSAMIDNKKYDVVSSGAFIEKGRQITVVAVDGNRIVVHEKP